MALYGGAYQEYVEIMKRRDRSSKLKPDERGYPDCNDSTYVSFGEVCNTCLSAVLPEDNACWRCGETIRWRKRHTDNWTTKPERGWRKIRSDFGTEWKKEWFPDGVYVTKEGEVSKYTIRSVTAVVEKRSLWSGWSD